MSRPAPASIAKLGITSVADNLGPGQEVNFASAFKLIFRTEIEQRIFTQRGESCARNSAEKTPGSSPCPSDLLRDR